MARYNHGCRSEQLGVKCQIHRWGVCSGPPGFFAQMYNVPQNSLMHGRMFHHVRQGLKSMDQDTRDARMDNVEGRNLNLRKALLRHGLHQLVLTQRRLTIGLPGPSCPPPGTAFFTNTWGFQWLASKKRICPPGFKSRYRACRFCACRLWLRMAVPTM